MLTGGADFGCALGVFAAGRAAAGDCGAGERDAAGCQLPVRHADVRPMLRYRVLLGSGGRRDGQLHRQFSGRELRRLYVHQCVQQLERGERKPVAVGEWRGSAGVTGGSVPSRSAPGRLAEGSIRSYCRSLGYPPGAGDPSLSQLVWTQALVSNYTATSVGTADDASRHPGHVFVEPGLGRQRRRVPDGLRSNPRQTPGPNNTIAGQHRVDRIRRGILRSDLSVPVRDSTTMRVLIRLAMGRRAPGRTMRSGGLRCCRRLRSIRTAAATSPIAC